MSKAQLSTLLQQRILIMDGAMGTMIQNAQLVSDDFHSGSFKDWDVSLAGMNDLLVLTRPEVIQSIHRQYLEAGADIITTNTFNATAGDLKRYHLEHHSHTINFTAAQLACQVAQEFASKGKPRFVAGVIGPTQKMSSISVDVNEPQARAITFDQLVEDYTQAAEALIAGGVDILLIETVFDTLNAKAAIFAILTIFERTHISLPIMISGTITDDSGRTLSGQTTEGFYNSVRHSKPLSVGLNCALGPAALRQYVQELARICEFAVSTHPNAGLPNELGEYDMDAEEFADHIGEWARAGMVNITGGCCGSTPRHIKVLADRLSDINPRSYSV